MNHDDIRLLDLMGTQYTQHVVPLQRLGLFVVPDVMDYIWDLTIKINTINLGTPLQTPNILLTFQEHSANI